MPAIKTINKGIMSFKLSGNILSSLYTFLFFIAFYLPIISIINIRPLKLYIVLWIYWLLVTQMNNCS